jgi:hypothetical protein
MNAGQLRRIAEILATHLNALVADSSWDSLTTALLNRREEEAIAVAENLARQAAIDDLSPSEWLMVVELHLDTPIGRRLEDQLRNIPLLLSKPELRVQLAQDIRAKLQTLRDRLSYMESSLTGLNQVEPPLQLDHCEIGVFFPREGVFRDLEEFSQQLARLDNDLRVVGELGGQPGSFKIRQLSSSHLGITIEALTKVGQVLLQLLTMILSLRKVRNEQRRTIADVEKINPTIAKSLREDLEKKRDETLDESVRTIVPGDTPRDNELRIQLRRLGDSLELKLNQGVIVEVRLVNELNAAERETSSKIGVNKFNDIQGLLREQNRMLLELIESRERILLPAEVESKKGL